MPKCKVCGRIAKEVVCGWYFNGGDGYCYEHWPPTAAMTAQENAESWPAALTSIELLNEFKESRAFRIWYWWKYKNHWWQ